MTFTLADICEAERRIDSKPMFQRPYALECAGRIWTIATDGRVLVAVLGIGADTLPDGQGDDAGVVLSTALDVKGQPVDLDALRAFCGEPTPQIITPCPYCGRAEAPPDWRESTAPEAVTTEENWCEECEGDGWVLRAQEVVRFRGALINRGYLALALAVVPGGATATAGWVAAPRKRDPMAMLCVNGDGWCVVVMSIRENFVERGEILDTFREAVPA